MSRLITVLSSAGISALRPSRSTGMAARRFAPMVATRAAFLAALAMVIAALPVTALAQAAGEEDRLRKLEESVGASQAAADNAWMLVCCALVLMMTGPGLALFYGGLVRRKNALSTMMQSFVLMAVVSVLWFLFGYSLAFGDGNELVGGLGHALLRGVGSAPNADYAPTIPHQTFMMFQLMFAIITPALITGAFAERIKFSAMLAFSVLWSTLVYSPLAHMVWGKGGLFNAALGGRIPALDFAGGTVVHISSGVSALVCALYIGKRTGYPQRQSPPHSMVLSFIGACLLWVGWFGFNAGSALASGGLATSAFVTTHFATAAGVLGWMAADWARHGKPSVLGAISGAVAGLVAVTPASGFVTPGAALVIGLAAGAICYLMTGSLKRRLGYDDSLDVFGVHGAAGTLGALMTGLFATAAVNPLFKDSSGASLPIGLIDGNPRQLMNQAIAVVCSWGLAAIGSFVILKLVDVTIGLRVTEKEEALGLDLTQHGERAYALEPAQAYSAAVLEPAMEPEVDLAAPALMQPQTAFSEAGD